jgi:hypothetical protein
MQNVMKKKSFIYVVGAVVVIGAAALIFKGVCGRNCDKVCGKNVPAYETNVSVSKAALESASTLCDLLQISSSDCKNLTFARFTVWATVETDTSLVLREEPSQGAELTPGQKELIAQAEVGQRIGISEIKVKAEDGSEKEMPDCAIKVRE